MFDYDFMVTGFAGRGIVAVLAGIVGVFLVARGQTFAGHALSHVGFAGATAAGLLGIAPLGGMVGFTLAAGIAMGLLGEQLSARDVAIGIVLATSLGFGLRARSAPRRRRGLARHHHRLLHRLANELLHHGAQCRRLLPRRRGDPAAGVTRPLAVIVAARERRHSAIQPSSKLT